MPSSPAFQFYPGDFLSNPDTLVMNAEEIGQYWLLICACWISGSLPKELKTLAQLARTQQKKFTRSWEEKISRCFYFDETLQGFRHSRLDKELNKQQVNSEKRRQAAEQRWKAEECKSNANALQMECLSSSSSSSSSEKKRQEPSPKPKDLTKLKTRPDLEKDAFLDFLAAKPQYSNIAVRDVFRDLLRYCKEKNETATRKRLLNWLDRRVADVPIPAENLVITTTNGKSPTNRELIRIEQERIRAENAVTVH